MSLDTEIYRRKEEVDAKISKVKASIDRMNMVLSCRYAYRLNAWEFSFLDSLKEQLETQISRRIPAGLSAKQQTMLLKLERVVGIYE